VAPAASGCGSRSVKRAAEARVSVVIGDMNSAAAEGPSEMDRVQIGAKELPNTPEQVASALRVLVNQVYDPCGLARGLRIGLADMGLIRSLEARRAERGWDVVLHMRLTSPGCFYFFYFEEEIKRLAQKLGFISEMRIEWDNIIDWTPDDMSDGARARLEELRQGRMAGGRGPLTQVGSAAIPRC
jgi:metal-sulfur cluster biosynthetic enzyme